MDMENIKAIKKSLLEDYDFGGGWSGDDWECTFYGTSRDLEVRELTLLLQVSDGRDEIVYITLVPSAEPRHYDAWMHKPGEDSMRLVLHCKAADLHEMFHQLQLKSLECLFNK